MPTRAPLLSVLGDIGRLASWWLVVAFIGVGLAWGGGSAAQEAWLEATRRPRPRLTRSQDRRIAHEVARGIAELEQFLDQQPHG